MIISFLQNLDGREMSGRRVWSRVWLTESNGYSKQLVRRLRHEVAGTPRGQVRGERQRLRREEEYRSLDGYLTLPYTDESVRAKAKSVVKKSDSNLRVAWRNRYTLKNYLSRSAFTPPQCPSGARLCNACESGVRGGQVFGITGSVYNYVCYLSG